ncbi:MAG: DUF4040 domain-containing protein [Methanosarcinaceae archaeon]|jgi:uncharacterized MnhB-related membrane protein|nr:DUF4040 domain-containing protein [Methanosarcinaceae archaeon]NKQ39499.1 DUF4040 domain-containing protein [Methanosarcinales archaeon]
MSAIPIAIFLVLIVILSILIVITKDLLAATIIFSIYSLSMAVLFTLLNAPDVALTEAVIGAGLTSLLFIVTIIKTMEGV